MRNLKPGTQNSELRTQNSKLRTQNSELRTQNSELRTQNSELKTDKPLLLIVEDNRDMRDYLRSCLAGDYNIEEAADGEAGLARALEMLPDLVISDVMMPRMDGYEFCSRLKKDERTSHIPVILLTARATMESRIEGLETGADDFLTKPFDAMELQVRVRNLVLQRKRLAEKFMKNASRPGLPGIGELPEPELASVEEKFLQRAVGIVHQHLADPDFSVEQFSDLMAMSRSQLYRKLIAVTSLSPNEFIRFTRLRKAAGMLARRTANVAEIAYDVGFNNPSYFSECFKKQFGVLPSDYK